MKILAREYMLCPCCMEEHEVQTVLVNERTVFQNIPVDFEATYTYCNLADTFYEDEAQMLENDGKLKESYKGKASVLTANT